MPLGIIRRMSGEGYIMNKLSYPPSTSLPKHLYRVLVRQSSCACRLGQTEQEAKKHCEILSYRSEEVGKRSCCIPSCDCKLNQRLDEEELRVT